VDVVGRERDDLLAGMLIDMLLGDDEEMVDAMAILDRGKGRCACVCACLFCDVSTRQMDGLMGGWVIWIGGFV
jgi:hypothetical protein